MTLDQTTATGMTLTEAAATKVKALAENEGVADLALRISVGPGGCAGLRYQLSLDEEVLDSDVAQEFYGVRLVTDQMSAPYLVGATIDFVDTIQQVGFTIDNPNAVNSCACGNSFH
ncbi:MAG: iron-sulfur cluster assembly accessory protein [Propionibacteriaceae bacterium]|nr:iron-sulfur cluster assembly accessory protein [Propionibacteriaceae bacterium]